jgi:hypothetical protein
MKQIYFNVVYESDFPSPLHPHKLKAMKGVVQEGDFTPFLPHF